MPDDLTITADPRQQAKLDTLLRRLQSEAGHGGEDATRWAAYYLLQSLGASTRKAKATLPFHPTDPGTRLGKRFVGYVDRFIGGKERRRYVKVGGDIAKATRNPRAGLAKQSWRWALADLRLGSAGGSRLRRPDGAVEATSQGGMDPVVRIENKLRYIVSAVRHGGKRGVETALDRATTAGLRYLDRRLQKAMR